MCLEDKTLALQKSPFSLRYIHCSDGQTCGVGQGLTWSSVETLRFLASLHPLRCAAFYIQHNVPFSSEHGCLNQSKENSCSVDYC